MSMETIESTTALTTRVLAPNPGPMTLDGTNTYIVRGADAAGAVVVDPGPADEGHLDRIVASGRIELILLTHHHIDHVEAAPELSRRTGAPVRAWKTSLCIGAEPLGDGERVEAGGVGIDVVHTPGHSADSVSFLLREDRRPEGDIAGSILTGDTILGRGTTIIAGADGSLGDYLSSLDALLALGPGLKVLPAHGPALPDLATIVREYLDHRLRRLAQVEEALRALRLRASSDDDTVRAVTDRVYADLAPELRFAGEETTRAQLVYLAERGEA